MIPIIPLVIVGLMAFDVAHRVISTRKLIKLEKEKNELLKTQTPS